MSKYNKTLKNYIIGGVKYSVSDKYLLCTATVSRDGVFFDMRAKTKRLYYPRGKAFILVTDGVMTGGSTAEILTETQAKKFLDSHPEGINESVYNRYMGKPAEL